MGNDIQTSTLWASEEFITPTSLNNFVNDANILATAISAKTLKTSVEDDDEFLINDSGTLKKTTKSDLFDSISADTIALIYTPGTVLQSVTGVYTANTALSVIIPLDDTTPTNAEGTQIISASITPKYADSTIRLVFSGEFAPSVADMTGIAVVYRGGVAVAATCARGETISGAYQLVLDKPDLPASASALVYTVRAGPNIAGNIRFNGNNTARFFNGLMSTTLTLQEIKS